LRGLPKPIVRTLEAFAPKAAVALRAWKHFYSGEAELRLLPALCDREKCAFDIGGNLGVYTYFMARFSKAVMTFEPHPELAAQLRRGFGGRVQIEECALSSREGVAALSIPLVEGIEEPGLGSIDGEGAAGLPIGRKVEVPTRCLDDFLERPVGFVKIDVEGHELSALEGGRRFIAAHRPSFLIEAEERHRKDAIGTLVAFLNRHGYAGYFLKDRELYPIEALGKAGSNMFIPNNFLFFAGDAQRDRVRLFLEQTA